MQWLLKPACWWLCFLILGSIVIDTYGQHDTSEDDQAVVNLSHELSAVTIPKGVQVLSELEYVRREERGLTLDLYRPEQLNEPLPVIVWIHGGGWRSGSKADPAAVDLVCRGFAVASIDFRSSAEAVFPAQIDDCRASICWLREHAEEYQLDPNRIGVWGLSSGGHLAALLGVTGDTDPNSRVQAVVDFYGPIDFCKMDRQADEYALIEHAGSRSPESLLVGGPIDRHRDLVAQANPLTWIHSGGDYPPFFIAHGLNDHAVPWQQSRMLMRALRDAGGHARFVASYTIPHAERISPELVKAVGEFFTQELGSGDDALQTPRTSPGSTDQRLRFRAVRRWWNRSVRSEVTRTFFHEASPRSGSQSRDAAFV